MMKTGCSAAKYRIRPSAFEFNDPVLKLEMQQMISDFEAKMRLHLQNKPINKDLTHVLPRKLYERAARIVELKPYNDREFEDIIQRRLKVAHRFYRTECDTAEDGTGPEMDMEDMDVNTDDDDVGDDDMAGTGKGRFAKFQLRVDPKTKARTIVTKEGNRMEDFLRKTSKERIKWQTKLYKTDKKLHDKPLFEQVEELIDLGAQDFADWLNGLGAEKSNITKDIIKQLFSIGIEGDTSKSLVVEPKEIHAIPVEVAREWNLNYMALQRRIMQVMKNDSKEAKVKERHVAFGRTLPPQLRRFRRHDDVEDIVPNFPQDMKTLESLFKGICHLRSVKILVEHLREHPEIGRPKYLVEQGMFKPKVEKLKDYTPLYQQFLTK